MSFSPFLKSPLTDLTGCIVSHQWYGPCQKIEMKALDCIEAYGLDRGVEKCEVLINDFKECASQTMQNQRIWDMRWERERQKWTGQRTKENMYAEGPTTDSF